MWKPKSKNKLYNDYYPDVICPQLNGPIPFLANTGELRLNKNCHLENASTVTKTNKPKSTGVIFLKMLNDSEWLSLTS